MTLVPGRLRPPGAIFSHWPAPDGWRLRRMDWPQPTAQPPRGTLLFAGGRGDFIEKYLDAYRHWHRNGWAVTAFDWRGQGHSQGDRPGEDLKDFAPPVDDLDALLRGIGAKAPKVAVGHSMGGHLLLRTLIERAPPLDAAILVAPMIRINSHPLPARLAPPVARLMCRLGLSTRPLWRRAASLPAAQAQRRYHLTSCDQRYADELWWWEQEPAVRLRAPSWGWVDAAYRSGRLFTPSNLRRVDLPILILGTARDRLVSPVAIEEVADWLPRAKLHLYGDAGHEILRERDEILADALGRIDQFLDDVLS